MDLGLKGKSALITGGTSGIGLSIARRLGQEGCTVTICGRDAARLAKAIEELRAGKIACQGFTADMNEPSQIKALVQATIEAAGKIDIVVSNAGTHLQGPIDNVTSDQLETHLRTKIIGPWELARQVAPHMRAQGSGRFIMIIGQAGKVPGANVIASAISNAAQHAFVKSLSDDLGRSNVLVNAVCPSRIASPLTDKLTLFNEHHLGRSLEQQESQWGAEVPLGRWGVPEDIANVVAFIASDRAGFIVGSNIDVDGGHQRSIL
jgi:3-oxoacyl-[acyl-carrier protein] reductase